ncbi:MAG: hypothetical protein AB8I08_30520 [Sandaracinaceae bacterium]
MARFVRRSLLGAIASLALAASLPACAAPTLPLPPPTALVESPPDADGMVTVTGEARPGAFVGCLNERTEIGVLVRTDVITGEYSLQVAAESSDVLTLWQFEGTEPGGQRREVVVPDL